MSYLEEKIKTFLGHGDFSIRGSYKAHNWNYDRIIVATVDLQNETKTIIVNCVDGSTTEQG